MQKDEVFIGRPVIHWEAVYENGQRTNPSKSKITSEVIDSDENLNCMIEGKDNPVSIKNLDTISPGSILCAQLQGCKGLEDNALNKATVDFFEKRGVKVIISQ